MMVAGRQGARLVDQFGCAGFGILEDLFQFIFSIVAGILFGYAH